jgi:hypothetical protein
MLPSTPGGDLGRVVRSPRFWRGTPVKALLLLLVANQIVLARRAAFERAQKENLLVQPVVSQAGRGRAARFDESVGNELWRYWDAIPDATKQPLVVLSGMSQMYAINDVQPNDQTIAEWLDDQLSPKGVRVFGLAAPNLDNEEALFLLLSVASDPHTRPATFIYGLCFDKFRNVDLRSGYQEFMRRHPEIESSWRETAERHAKAYPLASAKMLSTLAELHASATHSETSAEGRLRDAVGRMIPLIGERHELNATAQMRLYDLRNKLLGITPTTKRPIIESRYELNRQFLELIATTAREHGIQPVFYIIPLNPSAETPYVPDQYAAFKRWVATLTQQEQIPFADFEEIVPRGDWGFLNGGPDFKHFRGVGHRITADSIASRFSSVLTRSATIARAETTP